MKFSIQTNQAEDSWQVLSGHGLHLAGFRSGGPQFTADGGGMPTGRKQKLNWAQVTLERVEPHRHGPLLAEWRRRPHVRRWWGEADARVDLLCTTPETGHAIIAADGCSVGYIRWQTVDRDVLKEVGLSEIPEGAIDIDILIGEIPWLGCGVGSTALRLLLERLAGEGTAPLAGLCTSVENTTAIRAFEKAGFRKLRQYNDPTHGRCWVLVAELAKSTVHRA